MTSEELAYLAGILDGEGYIGIQSVDSWFYLKVMITNSSLKLIKWVQDRLPTKGLYINTKEAGYSTNTKPVYTIHLSGKKAKELLELLLPYLVIKRSQAEIALQFPIKGRSLTEEDKLQQAVCHVKTRKEVKK